MTRSPDIKNVRIHASVYVDSDLSLVQGDPSTALRFAQDDRALLGEGRRISFVLGKKIFVTPPALYFNIKQ